jgi:hypothetical protein
MATRTLAVGRATRDCWGPRGGSKAAPARLGRCSNSARRRLQTSTASRSTVRWPNSTGRWPEETAWATMHGGEVR